MAYGPIKARKNGTYRPKARAAAVHSVRSARSVALSRKRMVVPGFTRTGGFYKRMSQGGEETKFFDTALSFNFDATGEVPATGQLCLIPANDTESGRDGRKITVTAIQMKGHVSYFPATETNPVVAHMYLVLDKQCNGAAAAVTDVFTNTNLATQFRNLANSDRFVILKHWHWDFNFTAGVSGAFAATTRTFEFYKKCNIPMFYSGTAGAITEIRSNNLFLVAGSNNVSDDLAVMVGNARIRFQG